MFFTTTEMVKWLGLSVFEIWIHLLALLAFTLMLAFKLDPEIDIQLNNWWLIFTPLFIGDALNAYFCTIVYIRLLMDAQFKFCAKKILWSATFLTLICVFKFLLCRKLLGQSLWDYSEVFAPVYILLQLIAVRACQQS
ncbi:transmembrane protein 203-like isoform X2 [Anthonomus grandis grandis]|uniref:transmembrane protein 203-like isoform X2 n=1 Tax=Anthonomus grandis grandis TaxID=2921223 RepID=UPI002165175D|nr:transmembrane protein 203-like isoform X2 [Anthonomus grandis grandis]XP_050299930.1 transmembrane protein 203-like isoform X2 [Anthonomus grandis grandis]